ncbi:MAG: alanyl-tRNA editing protein [Clostridia bacterium]|nr:alanyl-tRNA editing protein [Clostridia bacterium]
MNKTIKLYDGDSHLFEFYANVISCQKNGEYYETVLDRTAFFPEGGGQSGDSGKIGETDIFDTQISDGIIYHYSNIPLDIGVEYKCLIDKEKRLRRMQNHSGEHLVSGLIYKYFGYDNVGFHMGHEDITLDTSGPLMESDIRKIEYLANLAIAENVPVTSFYPDPETLSGLFYRSKKDLEGEIRIVTIEGYDACACCAPHVSFTGEIGLIKLLDFEKNKGGTRIHMLCGLDALLDYDERYHMIAEAAKSLSVKQKDLDKGIMHLCEEISALKDRIYHLKTELLEYKISEIEDTDGNICFFEEDMPQNDMRRLMNSALMKCSGICAVFCGNDTLGYRFTASGKNTKMTDVASSLRKIFGAKCGGSDEMIQGSITSSKEKIKNYFGV